MRRRRSVEGARPEAPLRRRASAGQPLPGETPPRSPCARMRAACARLREKGPGSASRRARPGAVRRNERACSPCARRPPASRRLARCRGWPGPTTRRAAPPALLAPVCSMSRGPAAPGTEGCRRPPGGSPRVPAGAARSRARGSRRARHCLRRLPSPLRRARSPSSSPSARHRPESRSLARSLASFSASMRSASILTYSSRSATSRPRISALDQCR